MGKSIMLKLFVLPPKVFMLIILICKKLQLICLNEDFFMKIFYHCVWDYNEKDASFLELHSIPYKWYHEANYSWLIVEIDEQNPYCSDVLSLAEGHLFYRYLSYTDRDLQKAEYLTIRAANVSFNLENIDQTFEFWEPSGGYGGYYHKKMKSDTFYIKKPIKWGKSHFKASYDTGNTHLFCDDLACSILSQYKEVSMLPVFHSRTKQGMENEWYIRFEHVLPVEIIHVEKEKIYKCPACGMETWLVGPDHQLMLKKNELPTNRIMFKTPDIYSSGGNFRFPINVISHDIYVILKQKNMTKNLVLEPVVLV